MNQIVDLLLPDLPMAVCAELLQERHQDLDIALRTRITVATNSDHQESKDRMEKGHTHIDLQRARKHISAKEEHPHNTLASESFRKSRLKTVLGRDYLTQRLGPRGVSAMESLETQAPLNFRKSRDSKLRISRNRFHCRRQHGLIIISRLRMRTDGNHFPLSIVAHHNSGRIDHRSFLRWV